MTNIRRKKVSCYFRPTQTDISNIWERPFTDRQTWLRVRATDSFRNHTMKNTFFCYFLNAWPLSLIFSKASTGAWRHVFADDTSPTYSSSRIRSLNQSKTYMLPSSTVHDGQYDGTRSVLRVDTSKYITKWKNVSCEIANFDDPHLCELRGALRSRVLRVLCNLIKNVSPHWGGQNLTAVELSECITVAVDTYATLLVDVILYEGK